MKENESVPPAVDAAAAESRPAWTSSPRNSNLIRGTKLPRSRLREFKGRQSDGRHSLCSRFGIRGNAFVTRIPYVAMRIGGVQSSQWFRAMLAIEINGLTKEYRVGFLEDAD